VTDTVGFEYFDVEADVGVRAWGPRLEDAMAQAALGALALGISPAEVVPRERREVRAQAESPEALLVAWINECLYVHEVEGFAVARVEVDRVTGGVAHGFLFGEPIDLARHRPGTVVKAATMHRVSVQERAGRVEVQVVLDV
jgi:SHS2 domain-containing protein